MKIKRKSDHTIVIGSTYTTVAGDTPISVVNHLTTNAVGEPGFFIVTFPPTSELNVFTGKAQLEPISGSTYVELTIISPGVTTSISSIATWKWSTERNIARAYFDDKGVTNGILYTNKITFPAYAENVSNQPLIPFINYQINDIPPVWAYSMQFYMTKEGTQYIYWESSSVNKSESEYIYFNVSSFTSNATRKPTTASVLSYTFIEGDRMRVIRGSNDVVFDDTYDIYIEGLVVDPVISSVPQVGTFLKIKNVGPFPTGISEGIDYVLEIYRPQQQISNSDNQVYYEFGQQYDILDPTLPTRRHSGQVTDQVVGTTPAGYNFYNGDAYFRSRTIATGVAGYQTFNVMDRNFVDFFISAVSSVDGRPSIIDINAREAYYSTLIRHGEAYQANTNINGLNRFYAKNSDEYDYSFGDALRMVVKNRQLVILQKFKIGAVSLFSSIGKDPNGLTVVFNTDKLLNPIQYYMGDFGIGTCPESVASFNYAIYGCDNIKGIIWRLSNDGLVALSMKYKMNSWANDNLNQGVSNQKVYGAFDQRLDNYIIALSEDDTVCVSPYIADFDLPDGILDVAYYFSVRVTGSTPFALSNIVAPDGMDITVSGNTISFTGTAQLEWADTPITFTVTNACGQADIGPLPINVIEMITGTIQMWGGFPASPPPGYLVCDGSAISRTTYADLFAVTSTLYGSGDGSTTFNLPNIRKKSVAGYLSGDAQYGTVGATGGTGTATLTDQQMAHKHTYSLYSVAGSGINGDDGPTNFSYVDTDTSSVGNPALPRDPIDTRDPFIVLSFIIKT